MLSDGEFIAVIKRSPAKLTISELQIKVPVIQKQFLMGLAPLGIVSTLLNLLIEFKYSINQSIKSFNRPLNALLLMFLAIIFPEGSIKKLAGTERTPYNRPASLRCPFKSDRCVQGWIPSSWMAFIHAP